MLKLVLTLAGFLALKVAQGSPQLALESYQKGEFEKAAELYRAALSDEFQNASLLFNLGNSYYKGGQKGKAMAAYLRAQQLAPRDPDIVANLNFVKAQLKDDLPPARSIQDRLLLLDLLSLKEVFSLTVITLCLGFLLLTWGQWTRRHRRLGGVVAGLCLTVGVVLGLVSAVRLGAKPLGAIHVATAQVYAGPSDQNSVVVFELHEGAAAYIRQSQGTWLGIELSDGKRGWVPQSVVTVF